VKRFSTSWTPESKWFRLRSSRPTRRASVLVPEQVFSREILTFIRDLDTPEIHGYQPDFGYRVYTEKAIEMCQPVEAPISNGQHAVPAESTLTGD
jgi:hypothetical protein